MTDERSPVNREDTTRVPEPPQVRAGRERKLDGERLSEYDTDLRPYYCRQCGKEQMSRLVPRAWYTLTRATGSREEKPQRLGLYCSLGCLDRQMPRLLGIEADLGERFVTAPSQFRQEHRP